MPFSAPVSMSDKQDKPSPKRRKMRGSQPHKTAVHVTSYRPCTYCGLNLPSTVELGKKDNMKRHWALKHSVDLCVEMGVSADDEEEPVVAEDFIKHLDKMDYVYNSLHNMNYKIVPACSFFDIT